MSKIENDDEIKEIHDNNNIPSTSNSNSSSSTSHIFPKIISKFSTKNKNYEKSKNNFYRNSKTTTTENYQNNNQIIKFQNNNNTNNLQNTLEILEDDSITISSLKSYDSDLVEFTIDDEFSTTTTKNDDKKLQKYDLNQNQKIDNIIVQNSNDVTFGNKNYYQGPITINQFLGEIKNFKDDEKDEKKKKDKVKNGMCTNNGSRIIYILAIRNKTIPITLGCIILNLMIAVFLIIIGSTIAIVLLNIGAQEEEDLGQPRIITRAEWNAKPPRENLTDLIYPAKNVIIAHTAGASCKTEKMCKFRTFWIQNTSLSSSKDFNDIPYNFLVGGDGNIYEGRGWYKISAAVNGFNQYNYILSFIGNFMKSEPTKKQLNAGQWFIKEALKKNMLKNDYHLYGAKQLTSTDSPGDFLFEIIKKWPHFSEEL